MERNQIGLKILCGLVGATLDAGVKIACPTLALWGADYYGVGKMFDMPHVWAEMAADLRTHAIPQCGHLPQEEQPEIVNRLLLDFLEGWTE